MYNLYKRNYTTGRRFGFTLAEVLITLAIIGVVAVLTIPTLVANYQTKAWNTAATVFERKLEESLKVMNTQGTLAGYKTTESFVNEFSKHMKITKVCKNDDLLSCFDDKVMFGIGETTPEEVDMANIKTAKDFGLDSWGTSLLGLQFANGTSALIAYNPDCTQNQYSNLVNGRECIALLYDTSGFTKPNTSGKDLRSINVSKLGGKCAFEVDGKCYGAPFSMYSEGSAFGWGDQDLDKVRNICIEQGGKYTANYPVANYLNDVLYRKNGDGSIELDYNLARSYGFNVQDGEDINIFSSFLTMDGDFCHILKSDQLWGGVPCSTHTYWFFCELE